MVVGEHRRRGARRRPAVGGETGRDRRGCGINYAEINNSATIGTATITSNGLAVDAMMTNVSGDTKHVMGATSTSGAGSTGVGVAGSLALNIVNDHTTAIVPTGANVAAGTGAVTVRAENKQENTATAKAAYGRQHTSASAPRRVNVLDLAATTRSRTAT
jgi:hypothetical protein